MITAFRGIYASSRSVLAVCSYSPIKGIRFSFSATHSGTQASTDFPERGQQSSTWGGKNAWKLGFLGLTCSGLFGVGFAIALWGPPEKLDDGTAKDDKYSKMNPVTGYICRTWNSLLDFNQVLLVYVFYFQSIKDPVSEKLLPDPVQPPYYQPPYTLVLEINDILVHPDWKFRSGWRFKKRPALDLFLQQLSPFYEVVAFTNESAMTGGPVLMQMDPQGQFVHYRLFREATRYQNGKHIKDLSCLNRDLSRVILVDWDPDAAKLQPRNALIVKRWQGDESDRELIDLAAFLRMLAMGNVEDIRLVLDFYRESDDPLALFRERHEQLMEEQAKRKEETERAILKRPRSRFSFSGMSRA
ncbi:hypothetical protein EG68_07885 [Paragonimus skrjabini miyazakii]|uniref:Mitochondrial import inner membrane translocase subunit TIM50 n=1 Tax=Paragonimus skrjabini miyazakii TaxID=59628 RepID=A0A8S9Y9W1_9TREM|nr:hypothetical protein EG68_07885 [Paragonimus skrjabini miyazakii]